MAPGTRSRRTRSTIARTSGLHAQEVTRVIAIATVGGIASTSAPRDCRSDRSSTTLGAAFDYSKARSSRDAYRFHVSVQRRDRRLARLRQGRRHRGGRRGSMRRCKARGWKPRPRSQPRARRCVDGRLTGMPEAALAREIGLLYGHCASWSTRRRAADQRADRLDGRHRRVIDDTMAGSFGRGEDVEKHGDS